MIIVGLILLLVGLLASSAILDDWGALVGYWAGFGFSARRVDRWRVAVTTGSCSACAFCYG